LICEGLGREWAMEKEKVGVATPAKQRSKQRAKPFINVFGLY